MFYADFVLWTPDVGWWTEISTDLAEYLYKRFDEDPASYEGWKIAYVPTIVVI